MDHNEPNPFDIDAPASVGAFLASIPVHMKSHGKNCLNLQDLVSCLAAYVLDVLTSNSSTEELS